jgi:cell division protein FtsW (lipid II flippase)
MVQFSIAYMALGCAILLILVGIFAARHPSAQRLLSDTQRALLLGGIGGMLIFFVFLVIWTW